MDLAEARTVLGVAADSDWQTVRRRYREMIQRAHPDLGGSTDEAARVNLAFASLVRERRGVDPAAENGRDETTPSPARSDRFRTVERLGDDVSVAGDTIVVTAPIEETVRRVVAGLDLIGEITFLDRTGPVAEAVVVLEDGTSHSLVLFFKRCDGCTEVLATMEALESVASGRPDQVLRTLARFIPSG